MRVITLERAQGSLLVSADLHGQHQDFTRLKEIFLGGADMWVGLGDWVHGPDGDGPEQPCDSDGVPLYRYRDGSAQIVRELFALTEAHPGRIFSLIGNHEWAHVGGPRTSKFHHDEAAHLESQLTAAEVMQLHQMFASWPLCIRIPSCGVVLVHGALVPPPDGVAGLERILLDGDNDADAEEALRTGMTHYGFCDGAEQLLLERMGPEYHVVVHGHDRVEDGWCKSGDQGMLLCTSFGARRAAKSYLRLDLSRRYRSVDELASALRLLHS